MIAIGHPLQSILQPRPQPTVKSPSIGNVGLTSVEKK
jgi:hypothetical protein